MARLPSGPREPDEPDDDISSLFGDADDDIDVDDDPDAYEPAFPPVSAPAPPPRPSLPDPREAPPAYDIPELSMQVPPRPDATPRGPSTTLPGDGGAFFWGLTPNDDPDPLVHGDQPDAAGTPPAEDDRHHHHGLVPPTVPLAPYVPFVYEEPVAGESPAEADVPPEPVPPVPPVPPVTEAPPVEPDTGHGLPPGTVELPWLRSRRSERQDEDPIPAAPGGPGEDPTSTMPGVPSPPSPPPATERDETPADSRANSSWSLFGDPLDDGDESQQDEASVGAVDAQQPRAGGSSADDLPTTDIFAAFNAAAAAAGLPGVAASEAAAYDVPEPTTPESVWSWDQPTGTTAPGATAPGITEPGPGRGRGHDGHDGHDSDDGGPSPRARRIMLIIAGALLLVLLLIALFIVGRTVAQPEAAVTPTPTRTATATPSPTPTVAAKGPVAPGRHPWNALLGGECLQPFTTPWADTFTVVACTTPHAGQLVYTGVVTADAAAAFPGSDQLATQVGALCTRAGIVNLAAAGKYGDAQILTSYPVTERQWKQGQRSYYCFVNLASGQPITGSLAGPGPK